MPFWIVRHAQPLTATGICYGWLDVPADQQATSTSARKLAAVLPPAIRIICSPQQRCEQLALALSAIRGDLTYQADRRLMEMNFGSWEGRRWADIGQPAIDAWVADFPNHRPGGGESAKEFLQRVAGLWDETRTAGDAVWITHAGVIRAVTLLRAGIRSIDCARQWPLPTLAFGEWEVVEDRFHLSTP